MVPLGLLLLLLPPFESKYTSQSMAGTRGRRGCSRRAFHLRPSRDHALPPKRVFAFKSPVGDAALSLSQRPRIFPIAPAYNIASSRHRYFIIPRVPRPETPSSPQRDLHRANLVHSYFALTSPFPILPIFSFKNENEENWRKLPRRRCLRERKTNELFDFFVVTVETR